jgi:tetratricopeptide (TPR) repeat protein
MSNNSTSTEQLIRYLDGELETSDANEVQKNIETDTAAQAELEQLRLAKEAMKAYGLKNRIASIHTAMMDELKENNIPRIGGTRKLFRYSMRIAAAIVLLLGVAVLYQYYSATPETLFHENFQAFALRETRGNAGSVLEEAYKKQSLPDVIQQYNAIQHPQAEDYFLAGNAFLGLHQPEKAIAAFTALQQQNTNSGVHYFEEDTEYYLGLAYMDNNEMAKAIPIFEKIHADTGHPYHNKISSWFLRKARKASR